jgi:hypothetical protein
MTGPRPSFRWAVSIAAAIAAVVVAIVAYNAGVAHGLAASPQAVAAGWHPHLWFHPFGFLFPLFFLFVFFAFARFAFWGGPWRRGWHDRWGGPPPTFDDWHRQAHERMARDAGGSTPRT